ncbi:mucin-2 [Topomyia yanbarensis]|uniref:mucin-2 n=1 Tax=Topomyia yanbarensis TaxID=2498891 RepID=UPI00273BFDA9|nr:mucin-2 [Topomyia yanbarensis]XP_058824965.1 mucin-2 [Topomyia yanbarensis]
MNHNNSSRYTSFAFASGGVGGARGELSSGNLSRTLSSPMAESTQLESSGIRGNLYGSPIRQVGVVKRKPTSPLQNSKTNFRSSGNLTASGSGMDRLIDPKIYTDAQSRGLVNRLVKYHDKTQSPLNRSQSVTSLYSKPGQFPVVHLKKTEIKYSPRRNNSSITSVRIAPPEKSVFQANTRSNILRAGSLLIPAEPHLKMARTQQHEDEIDAENRVIAPSTELEAAPTRSVLDALKEISRKRINNEELDADRIKKQCKELSEIDSGGAGTKRAREITSSASPPSRGSADQQLQTKRLCSKNNDISSSLSSSLVMNTPKRVEHVAPRPARLNVDQSFSTPATLNATVPVSMIESSKPAKLSRIDSAPLPQITRIVPEFQPPLAERPQPKQPKLTLFNKKYDETVVRPASTDSEDQDDDDELGGRISFIKPKDKSPIMSSDKVALKRVERSKLSLILSCLSDDFDKDEESPIVTPKQASFYTADTVDAMPKVEEKKEAVSVPRMSGISALMNSPIKDPGLGKIVPPKPVENSKIIEQPKSAAGFAFGSTTATVSSASVTAQQSDTSFSFGTPTKPITSEVKSSETPSGGFVFGLPATTSTTSVPKSDPPPTYSFPAAVTTSAPAQVKIDPISVATTAEPSTTTNLISFSPVPLLKPQTEKTSFAVPSTTASVTTQSTATFGSGVSAFKPPATTISNVTATPAVTTSVTTLPAFGNPTTNTSTANNGGFSFGATVPKPVSSSANTFSFGSSTIKPPTAAVAPTTAPPSTTATPTFGGFVNAPTTTTTASSFGPATTAPAFGFSATTSPPSFGASNAFGGFGANNAVPTTTASFGATATPSTTSSNVFGAATATTKTEAPSFGQPNLNSTFSFGAASEPAAVAASNSGAFSFGAGSSNVSSTSSNIFGNAINASSTNNTTFGTNTSNAAPSFGTIGNNNQPSGFGAPPASTTNSGTSAFGAPGGGFGAAPAFGTGTSGAASAPSSVFGNATSTLSPFSSAASPSNSTSGVFGAAIGSSNNNSNSQTTSTSGAFTFGGSAANAAAPSTNKPFSFGGANNASNTPAPITNANKTSSFSFTAGPNTTAPPSTAMVGPNSTFGFSGASNNSNNNNNPNATTHQPPAFGSTNSAFSFTPNVANNNNNNTNQATVKPFSFGGATANSHQATPAAPTGGIFGGGAPIPTVTSPPAFNFSAGTNPPSSGGAFSFNSPVAPTAAAGGPFSMPNGGGMGPGAGAPMFSIGTGGGTQPRRTIKMATRRHK